MEIENLSFEHVYQVLAARLRRTLNASRKGIKNNKLTENDAKGAIIGRMENILAYTRNNKDKPEFKIPYTVISAYEAGERFINIVDVLEALPQNKIKRLIEISNMMLADLEQKANVEPGTAGNGFCIRCGKVLTNTESIAAGIGPICSGKVKKRGN